MRSWEFGRDEARPRYDDGARACGRRRQRLAQTADASVSAPLVTANEGRERRAKVGLTLGKVLDTFGNQ